MRAQRLHAPKKTEENPLSLEGVPLPSPAANQVLIQVSHCGVCHTDLHIAEGDIHPPKLPVTPGHQAVGTIEKVGEQVTQLKIGQRVGVPWLHSTCSVCRYCLSGVENLCEQARFTGFHVDGGFADYLLAEADYVLPIPETISNLQAAPLLCAGIVGFRSLRLADVRSGETVGLFGFGAAAHLAIQVLRYWKCEVFVFTRAEKHQRHAEELGAAWVGDANEMPPKELDRGVIFAPAGLIVPLALEKIRPGGTLAINAIHMDDIPSMPYRLLYGERTLRSVANATRQDGVDFLRLAAEIPIKATVIEYPLERANQALAEMKHSRINGEPVLSINSD